MSGIQSETENAVLKIYLTDVRLSEDGLVEKVAADLNSLVQKTENSQVLLSLRDVSFVNSSMIGELVQLNKRCRQESIDFRLCDLNPNLIEVFSLMQLPKIMTIHPDEKSAMNGFETDGTLDQ